MQPGATASFPFTVHTDVERRVDLAVSEVPEGWAATLSRRLGDRRRSTPDLLLASLSPSTLYAQVTGVLLSRDRPSSACRGWRS